MSELNNEPAEPRRPAAARTGNLNGAVAGQASQDRTVTLAFAGSAKSTRWKNVTRSLSTIGKILATCEEGTKDGRCFLAGALSEDGPRANKLVTTIEMLPYDIDNGQDPDVIASVLRCMEVEAWIYPTYNHEKPTTKIDGGELSRYAKLPPDKRASDEQAIDYLRQVKGYTDAVLEGATVQRDGFGYIVKHKPLPRYRVVLFLSRAVALTELGDTFAVAEQAYKRLYRDVARSHGIEHHDSSCEDLSRVSYTHRRPGGVKSWVIHIEGDLLNPDRFIAAAKAEVAAPKKVEPVAPDDKQDAGYKTPGLARWFSLPCGDTFRAADFVEKLGTNAKVKAPGQVECVCPNEGAHSDGGDGRRTCFAKNPSVSLNGHPTIGCNHASCKEVKLTGFVDKLLQQHEVGVETLDAFTDTPAPKGSSIEENSGAGDDSKAQAEIDRLAHLPRFDYERLRKSEAKKLSVTVAALDDAVAERRMQLQQPGEQPTWERETVPWSAGVDGYALALEILQTFQRFLILPPCAAETMVLWVLFAHAVNAAKASDEPVFEVSPYLTFLSPAPECGKTRALKVLSRLCARPLLVGNATGPVAYRIVDKHQPTLFLDEAETYTSDDEGLRGILDAAHDYESANIPRCVGKEHEVVVFRVWCPKAVGLIGKLPATIMSRSIVVQMRRKQRAEKLERLLVTDRETKVLFDRLNSQCARWVRDRLDELRQCRPAPLVTLADRAVENWTPLLAVADTLGGDVWPAIGRMAASALSGDGAVGDDSWLGITLLADTRRVFDKAPEAERSYAAPLATELCELPGSAWADFANGHGLSPQKLARLLKNFGIRPREDKRGSYYLKSDFAEAWASYCPQPDLSEDQKRHFPL